MSLIQVTALFHICQLLRKMGLEWCVNFSLDFMELAALSVAAVQGSERNARRHLADRNACARTLRSALTR
jgi:hypothetical protein